MRSTGGPAPGRALRAGLVLGLAALLASGGACSERGSERGAQAGRSGQAHAAPAGEGAPDVAVRRRAARAGVEWMLAHWREMPPGWAHVYLLRLSRVMDDPALADRIGETLRRDAEEGHHVELPEDLASPDALAAPALTPVLFELLRRKRTGLDHEAAVSAIETAVRRDETAFWRPRRATPRAVTLHLFHELGIATRMTLAQVEAPLARRAGEEPAARLAADDPYVYALAHLVLVRSGYYQRHVERAEVAFAIPILERALAERVEGALNLFEIDLMGEVLSCLALLRVPDAGASRAARARLIAQQNADGSWGDAPGAGRRKVHPTFNGIMATWPLPAELPVTRWGVHE